MATVHDHPRDYPEFPSSLSAGNHADEDPQRVTPNTIQNITPYLGLRARLSQVWINRWTILLFLVLVRTLLAVSGLNNDLGSARTQAMSACSGVESMGSAMASMPHYLSAGVNELAASGVEKAVHGLMSLLLLTITGVEELVVFYIHMLTQTYLCLITLVVAGSLHVALKVIEDASDFLNSTLKGIGTDIGNGVSDFTNDFNKFTNKIASLPEIGGSVPTINLNDSVSKLDNLQLPSTLDQNLTQLNDSIPNFSQVQNFTDSAIRFPFEEVKKLVNGSLSYTFDRSVLPVPDKEHMTFCSDDNGISDFFDGLAHTIQIARRAFIAVLVILALLVCIPMAYQEIRRWHTMQQRAKLVGDHSLDPLDVIYIASRPYTATAGIKAAAPFNSSKRQVLTRWVIAYATSPPALFVLSLGITGLIACLCQYILLKTVEKEVPALFNQIGDFAGKVVGALNNASSTWANGTNGEIVKTNNDINSNIFGWVNTSTHALNDTLNAFIDNTTSVLNLTFGGTVLYDPVTELFNCLIGLKVDSIEKGLTWVSDNAHIDFPLLPNDTFSQGAANSISADKSTPGSTNNATNATADSSSFLASPGDKTTDQITGAVQNVVNRLIEGIRIEAIISFCLLLVWLIILLLGIARAVYVHHRPERVRAVGGPEPRPQKPFMSIVRGPAPAYEPPVSNPTSNNNTGASNTAASAPAPRRPFPSFSATAFGWRQSRQQDNDSSSAEGNRARRPSSSSIPSSGAGANDHHWTTDTSVAPSVDEKAGHAGFHPPAREESPTRWEAGRKSVYPTVEK